MTNAAFNDWALEAETIRDETLQRYARARTAEERAVIAKEVEEKLNGV